MSIFVNKEMRALIPPLSEEELDQLEENVLAEGIRDPLVTWPQPDGREMLIDGHNRFDISCRHNGIPFKVVRKEFADMDEAKVWVINNQLGRRNIHELDKAALLAVEEKIVARQAEERQRSTRFGGDGKISTAAGATRDIMGEKMGVSGKQYEKLKTINEKATEHTKQQIRDGEKSVNRAYIEIKEKERKKSDISARAALHEAEERNADFQQSKTVSIARIEQNKEDVAEIAKSRSDELYNAIKKILFIAAGEFDFSVINRKTVGIAEVDRLEGELYVAIETLTKIRKMIGGE